MAAQGGGQAGDAYATLLLSDTYLPGALVLAHSLRDAGTTKKLVVLVTEDTVSNGVITQLRTVYDEVIPVPRIRNSQPANLQLMNRTDLHSAFTKINLWKLTQFRFIVYIDADVVAYRAPDELFNIEHPFSAAPDIGWPDLFNTGVMALKPNMGDFYAMSAMAERGISFDGADQGLINMHFRNTYNRISFTYNVTPSAHYQYLPAQRHFQSSINMVHFIGPDKPWFQGRDAHAGNSPYNEMVGKWWSVYDRHYRGSSTMDMKSLDAFSTWDAQRHPPPAYSKPEAGNFSGGKYEMSKDTSPFVAHYASPSTNMWYDVPKQRLAAPYEKPPPIFPWEKNQEQPSRIFPEDHIPEQKMDLAPLSIPPSDSEVSADEGRDIPSGTSTFEDSSEAETDIPGTPSSIQRSDAATPTTPTIRVTTSDPWTFYMHANAWDDIPEIERYVGSMQKHRRARSLKTTGPIPVPGRDHAEHPEEGEEGRRRVARLTDFPSSDERPSLPVTPAPVHRPQPVSDGNTAAAEDPQLLPAAEGVPEQTQWVCSHGRRWNPADCLCDLANDMSDVLRSDKNPEEQLAKLTQQHAELLRRLSRFHGGASQEGGHHLRGSSDLPHRDLPFGSEDLVSPTYVKPEPVVPTPSGVAAQNIVSPRPVRGVAGSGAVGTILSSNPDPDFASYSDADADSESDPDPETTPLAMPPRPAGVTEKEDTSSVRFTSPGPALKRGEIVPTGEAN